MNTSTSNYWRYAKLATDMGYRPGSFAWWDHIRFVRAVEQGTKDNVETT